MLDVPHRQIGALAYGELGAMNPAAGGLYVYLRDAFGPLTAFLYGWTFFLVIATGSAATLAVASTSYLQQFVTLGPLGQKLAAVALLAIVAAINVRSTRGSADVQNWSTAIKVGALLIMSAVLVVSRPSSPIAGAPFWPASVSSSLLSGMGLGMIGVLWAMTRGSSVAFFLGTAVAGVGFGPGFQGAVRSVVSVVAPHERAGTLSIVFIVSYISFGVPAIIAGSMVRHAGLAPTAQVFSAVVMALAAAALIATALRLTSVSRAQARATARRY